MTALSPLVPPVLDAAAAACNASPRAAAPTEYAAPEAVFPCTVGQRKTLAQERARPGNPTLNIAARWRLEGPLRADLLEQALRALIARHEPLRTRFVEHDGVPAQEVLAEAPFRLETKDLRAVPAERREAEAAALAREEARQPFDPAAPPLLRATLVRLDEAAADLLVTTHYLVGDCWSNGILAREAAELYDALAAGRPAGLPPFDLQFGDYARWQEAWLAEGGAEESIAYWRQRLAGLPAFHVPTDAPPPAVAGLRGDILGMAVPPALAAAAQEMARSQTATFFMLGVAALAALLHRWTGAEEVVFGTQVAGREEVELEGLVGPFVNTVALRLDVSGDPAFATLLDRVRQAVGDALEHAAAPIEVVAPVLDRAPAAPGRRDPLTAVNFLIQRAFTRDATHGDLALRGVPNFSPGSKYDLNLFLVERPSGWRASCEFDPELFSRRRAEWLVRQLLGVLEQVAADPRRRLSALPLAPLETAAPSPAHGAAAGVGETPATALLPERIDPAAIAAAWAEVLRLPSVPPDANFFALGGDSVRAAQLVGLVRQRFGRSLTLGQMFRAPTLAEMARMLNQGAEDATQGVVMVQPNGGKPPIFAINNTGIFYTLSRHLGADQPFVAVQALDPEISPSLHPTALQAIAARYVETIRQVRPHGPYTLLGLCAAGKVALEVAQQLGAAGETVALLAVVDTWAPGHFRRMGMGRRALARLWLRWVRLSRQVSRIREGTLSLRGFLANRGFVRRTRNAAFEAMRRRGILGSVPPGVQNNLFVDFLDRAAADYEPRPYAGRVLVFHGPEQPRGRFLDPTFGWKDLVAGPLDVVAVPADIGSRFVDHHQGLFQDPGAKVMAGHIAAALG